MRMSTKATASRQTGDSRAWTVIKGTHCEVSNGVLQLTGLCLTDGTAFAIVTISLI